jgi:hypothetical protein
MAKIHIVFGDANRFEGITVFFWIAAPLSRLVMTCFFSGLLQAYRPRNDDCGFASPLRHCEQSEAIQPEAVKQSGKTTLLLQVRGFFLQLPLFL